MSTAAKSSVPVKDLKEWRLLNVASIGAPATIVNAPNELYLEMAPPPPTPSTLASSTVNVDHKTDSKVSLFPLAQPLKPSPPDVRFRFQGQSWPQWLSTRLLAFWSRPIKEQELHDCWLFALQCLDLDQRKRVLGTLPDQTVAQYRSWLKTIDRNSTKWLPIQLIAADKENNHTAIDVGNDLYFCKLGYKARYAILSWAELTELFPYPTVSRTKLHDECDGCGKVITSFRRCTACKQTQYCSPECQSKHWTIGGHRTECPKLFRFPTLQQLEEVKAYNETLKARMAVDQKAKSTATASQEPMLRTQAEIFARFQSLNQDEGEDMFGVRRQKLVRYLEYKHAAPHLESSVTAATWLPEPCIRSAIVEQMRHYMAFAWEKANDKRGLSANRSLEHFHEWVWLLGDAELVYWKTHIATIEYEHYGKERLIAICERYNIEWKPLDNGERVD